jgi:hypothetical protein
MQPALTLSMERVRIRLEDYKLMAIDEVGLALLFTADGVYKFANQEGKGHQG